MNTTSTVQFGPVGPEWPIVTVEHRYQYVDDWSTIPASTQTVAWIELHGERRRVPPKYLGVLMEAVRLPVPIEQVAPIIRVMFALIGDDELARRHR